MDCHYVVYQLVIAIFDVKNIETGIASRSCRHTKNILRINEAHIKKTEAETKKRYSYKKAFIHGLLLFCYFVCFYILIILMPFCSLWFSFRKGYIKVEDLDPKLILMHNLNYLLNL